MIDLAFFAPDTLQTVLDGSQPIAFTSQLVKHNPETANWNKHRDNIAVL